MTVDKPPSFYGLRMDVGELGLSEMERLGRLDGERETAALDDLVATQSSVVTEHVNRYRSQRAWWDSPITVIRRDGVYYIVDGHHRAAAASDAGADRVPVEVIDG